VKVLLAAVLIDALHAAFEDREVAFDGVGMDRRIVGRYIFFLTVLYDAMLRK
jgi:hypothetical protein